MSKIDFTDVTFTIPIKLDSDDRKRNLNLCIQWIISNFDTNIVLFEIDKNKQIKNISNSISNIYYEYHNSCKFHRTKFLNDMARISDTPIIINHDIDVVFPRAQMIDSVNKIRSGEYDGMFPYDKRFIDMIPETIHKLSKNKFDFSIIDESKEKSIGYDVNAAKTATGVARYASVGGSVVWNKSKFIEGGMENENFVSYGFEDNERVYRFETLGYKLGRTEGNLYHMSHSRGVDSGVTHSNYVENRNEYDRIRNMSRNDLQKEVSKWGWNKIYD